MISSTQDFDDATAFERWALEGLVPLARTRPHAAVKDIAENAVIVRPGSVVLRVIAGGVREVGVELRPLAFGAAWKVVDLLVELGLSNAGRRRPRSGKVTFEEKAKFAKSPVGIVPPLTTDPSLWAVLGATYVATMELRHCLVHRRANVDATSGTLTGCSEDGRPLAPMTVDQQEAFCRAIQRAAASVLSQRLSARERSDVAWQLDQLRPLHQHPALGGRRLQPPPLIIAPTALSSTSQVLDVPFLLTQAKASWPQQLQFDLTVALPDGRHVIAELENLPNQILVIDPAHLPPFFELWEGDRG